MTEPTNSQTPNTNNVPSSEQGQLARDRSPSVPLQPQPEPDQAPRSPLQPDTALPGLNSYRLVRQLGKGGFAEVWLVEHELDAEPRAVKFFLNAGADNRNIEQEKKVLRKLQKHAGRHQSIVRLMEWSLDSQIPWLMYQYIEGRTLKDTIKVEWSVLSPAERLGRAVEAFHTLAAAVGACHQLAPPIVHRDLKPANVLVDRNGTLRITDFGLGGVVVDPESGEVVSAWLPRELWAAGTAGYASKQQRRGYAPTPRDDVYALGVIAYQMITGQVTEVPGPHFGRELHNLGAPGALIDLIGCCIDDEEGNRPANGADLAARIPHLPEPEILGPQPTSPDAPEVIPPAAPRFAPGDSLAGASNWKLVQRLGVGRFGEVWLVCHEWKSETHVVKFFTHPVARDRLVTHEKKVLVRVMKYAGGHPNIVPLLDGKLDGETPWLMYEYVHGGTLADAIPIAGEFAPAQRFRWAVKVLHGIVSGLSRLHQLDPPIVHRDVKPQNVLMAGDVPRLTDFGIGGVASEIAAIDGAAELTGLSARLPTMLQATGTLRYSSPEQLMGSPPHPRDDVYALGVIAYQMVMADLRIAPGPDAAHELRELQLPDEFVALILKSAATNPQRRPRDAVDWELQLSALS